MLAIALALAAQTSSAASYDERVGNDPESAEQMAVVLCDPQRFRFSIRASADAASVDRSYPQRIVVPVEELSQMLPSSTGQLEIRGDLIRYVRCGPYTVKLEGDEYNGNVEGESGAYPPFASVRIISANRLVYPQDGDSIRLVECERTLPRARPCPTGYAVRIDGEYDAQRQKLNFVETVSSIDDSDSGGRKVVVRRWFVDDELSLWHPAD